MIELIFLHDFARSAKIKCGGFDWTKFHTFKHVHLSLISVVYLLYLIIIGTFLCTCLCVNIWRIIALLLAFYETKGILVILTMWCVPYVGGSQVGPAHPWWSLDGDKLARRKARWQALRFTSGSEFISGNECAGAGGQSWHQDASSHPEVDLYPEANVLALADKELHPEGNVLALEDKVHPSASARVRLHKCSEMSATFQKSFVQS